MEVDGALLTGIIVPVASLFFYIGIICYRKNKKKISEATENDDDDDVKDVDIEQDNTTNFTKIHPESQRQHIIKRSWIQRVARRANEFGRQVPENIQVEEEIYDDFVDTFMTIVLWLLLMGTLLFTIIDEFTNPINMAIAFCSEDRSHYCNKYYDYEDLTDCGGEAGDRIGQADGSARTSMCGIRSNGDHILSILTNYGALSGLETAICRYIANAWKGLRR